MPSNPLQPPAIGAEAVFIGHVNPAVRVVLKRHGNQPASNSGMISAPGFFKPLPVKILVFPKHEAFINTDIPPESGYKENEVGIGLQFLLSHTAAGGVYGIAAAPKYLSLFSTPNIP